MDGADASRLSNYGNIIRTMHSGRLGGLGGLATHAAFPGGVGANNQRAGGGGGAVGVLQTFTPTGVEPNLMPVTVSPAFSSVARVGLH